MAKNSSLTIIDNIHEMMQSAGKKGITSSEILDSCSSYKRDTVYRSLYRLVHEGSAKKTSRARKSATGLGYRNTVYVAV